MPEWIIDPSVHPLFSRATHITASATSDTSEGARVRAQVDVLLQLGGVEAAFARSNSCDAEAAVELVPYHPFPLSWRFVEVEEGRYGDVYYAFAAIPRGKASNVLRKLAGDASAEWSAARERAWRSGTPDDLTHARAAFSVYAGLLLELSNLEANRSRLNELHVDFAGLQKHHAATCAGIQL